MPLLVRGPAVQAGSITNELTLNTDFMPTFLELGGIAIPSYVDGTSLVPLLNGTVNDNDTVTDDWRTAILLELRKTIFGIRTNDGRKYIEYGDGFKEYYDLNADPYELRNLVYYGAVPPTDLRTRLQALKGCAGDTCRTAENGGP